MSPGAVWAAVLAAGAGRRLGGGGKAGLRLHDGRSFLRAILESCEAARLGGVVVVGRPGLALPDDVVGRRYVRVDNPAPERTGMLGSIHAALGPIEAARAAALLVWPVDCPRVPPEVVGALVDEARRRAAAIVQPRYAGRRGHPALFAARLFPALRAAPPTEGARAVVRAHAEARCELPVACPAVLDDIDTPEQLERVGGVRPGSEAGAR